MNLHQNQLKNLQLNHDYIGASHDFAERRTRWVMYLTIAFMVVEIVCGYLFGSMALLADGWHMASHAAAFGISLFAYNYARKHKNNPEYSFGTWKVGVLAGFASAVLLSIVGFSVIFESVERIYSPVDINYRDAIGIAVLGLLINVLSAFLLHGKHDHEAHSHPHSHDHAHDANCAQGHGHHVDLNHKSALVHVIADALTSVLAIAALLLAYWQGWQILDPVVGLIGAAMILAWAYQLIRQTGWILIDRNIDAAMEREIRDIIEGDADNRISDLHLWQVGPNHFAAIIALVTHTPKDPAHYKSLLSRFTQLVHISIEVNPCKDETCQ